MPINLRGGWALIRSSWASWMQYRSFFFVLAFGWMAPPLVSLFVWSTAAGEQGIAGLGRGQFVAYYLTLILVNQFTYAQTNWTVGDVIPVGIITTIPAEALTGRATPVTLAASLVAAVGLVIAASALFRRGLRRYASASS